MKDPQLRATWGRYALIGAAIRSEPLAVRSRLRDDVAARVGARLSADSGAAPGIDESAAESQQSRGSRSQFARGAWGMAVAASVAAVSLLVLRSQAPDAVSPAAVTAQVEAPVSASEPAVAASNAVSPAEAVVAAAIDAPPSYTTPVDDSTGGPAHRRSARELRRRPQRGDDLGRAFQPAFFGDERRPRSCPGHGGDDRGRDRCASLSRRMGPALHAAAPPVVCLRPGGRRDARRRRFERSARLGCAHERGTRQPQLRWCVRAPAGRPPRDAAHHPPGQGRPDGRAPGVDRRLGS